MLKSSLRRLVLAALLGVWCFPAVGLATPLSVPAAEVGPGASSKAAPARPSAQTEGAALGAREQASQDLQNFRGGAAYIYIGGGATLVLCIILLILLI